MGLGFGFVTGGKVGRVSAEKDHTCEVRKKKKKGHVTWIIAANSYIRGSPHLFSTAGERFVKTPALNESFVAEAPHLENLGWLSHHSKWVVKTARWPVWFGIISPKLSSLQVFQLWFLAYDGQVQSFEIKIIIWFYSQKMKRCWKDASMFWQQNNLVAVSRPPELPYAVLKNKRSITRQEWLHHSNNIFGSYLAVLQFRNYALR